MEPQGKEHEVTIAQEDEPGEQLQVVLKKRKVLALMKFYL